MTEDSLPGGYTTGAVLIGDVIHKPAEPWTATVHALLRHLEDAGFDGAPRALGFDDQGREMLTYLPGDTVGNRPPWPAWAYSDRIRARRRLAHSAHKIVASWRGEWRRHCRSSTAMPALH
jgi:hypothetical protein